MQGTRSYMSPEQIRGEPLDGRADIYSFGATCYELVTGRPPFRGASSQDLLTKHITEKPVSPRVHNPDVTQEFGDLVLHMLAKKREDRPQDFHEVLMKLQDDQGVQEHVDPKPARDGLRQHVQTRDGQERIDGDTTAAVREGNLPAGRSARATWRHARAGAAARRFAACAASSSRSKQNIFSNLTAWQTIQVSRHPERPQTVDYIDLIFEEFVELHGDRAIGDDRAIRTGFARLGDFRVMLIGHQKGRTLHERTGLLLRLRPPRRLPQGADAACAWPPSFACPIICLIDTPGAFPGIGAEERGQSQLIATNLLEMCRLPTPIVCVVIGEGGSGGALGIGIGDRVSMLEHAYYSVISPEGCAGILWKEANETTKPLAAEALKLTAKHLAKFGVIDDIIPEPLGGRPPRPPRDGATPSRATSSATSANCARCRPTTCSTAATRSSARWAST